MDQVLTAAVHSPSEPFSGIDELNGFVAEVNAFRRINTLEEIIPQVRALVINAEAERIVAMPVGGGNADGVIRVDEVVGRGVQVELGEYSALQAELQAIPPRLPKNLYIPNVSPKPTDATVYRTPDDLKRLMLTKNCGCFGSARSGRNRSPTGKTFPSPVRPITLLTAPGLPLSAGSTTIATSCVRR